MDHKMHIPEWAALFALWVCFQYFN
jgi:hypothetical protein